MISLICALQFAALLLARSQVIKGERGDTDKLSKVTEDSWSSIFWVQTVKTEYGLEEKYTYTK